MGIIKYFIWGGRGWDVLVRWMIELFVRGCWVGIKFDFGNCVGFYGIEIGFWCEGDIIGVFVFFFLE